MSIRLPNFVSASSLLVLAAIPASIVIGAMVTVSPVAAIALPVVCAALAVALTRPSLLFAAGILLLTIEPEKILGPGSAAGRPETFKLVLYACTIPVLLNRGVARRRCAPLVMYGVVTILTELLGTPLPGLTTGQTAASLATLCLGWLVLAIDWRWCRDHPLLKIIAWVPTLSLLIGLTLQSAGILSLFAHTSPPRIQGATIAPWLGAFSLYAVMACLVLSRREQWPWARRLGFVNVMILCGTLTRGTVIALCILAIPSLVRFGQRQLAVHDMTGIAKLALAVATVVAGAAVVIPGLIERGENATVYVTGQGGSHEIASGRFRAWAFAYEQATVNIAFGRGIGAGPIAGRSPGSPIGFTAQHNEYVRMLLEVGVVGGTILLITILTTFVSLIKRAPYRIRADLAAAGVAFAIYSVTENTLSATPLALAFFLVVGVSGSRLNSSRLTAVEVSRCP